LFNFLQESGGIFHRDHLPRVDIFFVGDSLRGVSLSEEHILLYHYRHRPSEKCRVPVDVVPVDKEYIQTLDACWETTV
jgi:hypothetical protein